MRAGFLGVLTMAGCCFAISPPSRAQTNDMIFANFKQSFCTKMGDADLNRLCQASKSREDLKSKIADQVPVRPMLEKCPTRNRESMCLPTA
jgi:hypothetical protein